MKKLFFSIFITVLTLVSIQSKAQTWSSSLTSTFSSGPTGTSIIAKLRALNSSVLADANYSHIFQAVDGGSAYTVIDGSRSVYFFAFISNAGVINYFAVSLKNNLINANTFQSSDTDVATFNDATNGLGSTLPTATPIDGGVSILLAGGALAHIRRKKVLAKAKNA